MLKPSMETAPRPFLPSEYTTNTALSVGVIGVVELALEKQLGTSVFVRVVHLMISLLLVVLVTSALKAPRTGLAIGVGTV